MKEFALVTAVTPPYLKKLKWCLPTWPIKKQLAGKKIYVFHHGFSKPEKQLAWIGDHFDKVQFVEWMMPEYATVRELMLSSFVLGTAEIVGEPYFIKLDADAYCIDSQDIFHPDEFFVDLFSHRWGYTKPGWWIDKLDAWVAGKDYTGGKDESRRNAPRIQSIACLHRTEFVRRCAEAAGHRLPVPSHDTFLWYMAENFSDCTWGSANLKKRGLDHNANWRGIREGICASEAAFNPFLNRELLNHVQVHITNACNIGCNNCDRCCGLARDDSILDLDQLSRFVTESIDANHRWVRVDIIGGEPMLYPELDGLFREMDRYRRFSGRTKFRLTTNGTANPEKISEIPAWVSVRNSAKDCGNKSYDFETFNIAPMDEGFHGCDAKACSIPWRCGLALTPHGYYLCGAGYGVARVWGIEGIPSLAQCTPENLMRQRERLCEKCGHSRSVAKRDPKQKTSKSWATMLEYYQQKKPVMRLY